MNMQEHVSSALSNAQNFLIWDEKGVPVPTALNFAAESLSSMLRNVDLPISIPHVNISELSFCRAVIAIILAPMLWNFLGRLEYYTKILSTIFIKPAIGAAALAIWIFFFSLYRDALFFAALENQPRIDALDAPEYHALAGLLGVIGLLLVLSSFFKLGFFGTYLGDYFGILMDKKVTGFPFSVMDHPMYDGSSMLFLAKAILERSPAGIALTVLVFIMYRIACLFEEPFTARIYANRAQVEKGSRSHMKQN